MIPEGLKEQIETAATPQGVSNALARGRHFRMASAKTRRRWERCAKIRLKFLELLETQKKAVGVV